MNSDLKLLIYFTLAALPSYLIRFSMGSIPFTLLEFLVLTVIFSFLFSRRTLKIFYSSFNIPILLLLLSATIGVFVAPDHLAALGIWKAYFVEPILFFFVVKSTLTQQEDRKKALQALGLGAILVSVFAIVQYVSGWGIPIPWDFEKRVTSFFPYPNAVGLYLAPIVTIAILSLFKKNERQKTKWYWLLVTTLGLVAIVLAKTEAALVAIPASLLLVWLFKSLSCLCRPDKTRQWIFPFTSIIIALSVAFSVPAIAEKLLLHDSSGLVRRSQWSETIQMLQAHSLFGAGLSGYQTALLPYHHDTQYEIFQYPHDIFLNIWSELGLLGLLAFLLLALQVLRVVKVAPFVFAALLTMTIHGLVDVPYFKNDLALMTWSLLALL